MALFWTESVVLSYSNLQAAKQWWVDTFDCKVAKVPDHWDNPLPSDVALRLPADAESTILLTDLGEALQAGFDRSNPVVSVIFAEKLQKAHEYISSRGVLAGPIQDGGDTHFFEVRDLEGNLIQVCKET